MLRLSLRRNIELLNVALGRNLNGLRPCLVRMDTTDLPSTVVFEPGVEPKRKQYDRFVTAECPRSDVTIVDFEVDNVGSVSGIPEEHIVSRTAYIFKPAKYATQSGIHHTHRWKIEFDNRERWESPLIGWCSKAMSFVFVKDTGLRKMVPPAHSTIQKLLDENAQLIQSAIEYQNIGHLQEAMQYEQVLHRNLVYLASLADVSESIMNELQAPFESASSVFKQQSAQHARNDGEASTQNAERAAKRNEPENVYGQQECTSQGATPHSASSLQSNPSVLQQQLQQSQSQMVSQPGPVQYLTREQQQPQQQQQSMPQIYYSQQYQQQPQYGQNFQVNPRPIPSSSAQNYYNQANMPQSRIQYAMQQQQQQTNLAFQQPTGGDNSASIVVSNSASYGNVQRNAFPTHVSAYDPHAMQSGSDADSVPSQMMAAGGDMNVCHQASAYRSVPLYPNYPQQQPPPPPQSQNMYNEAGSR